MSPTALQSAPLFDQIAAGIKADPGLAKKVKGVIQFIVNPGGAWVVDLKNGSGSVTEGKAKKADMTLTVKDADLVAIAAGKLNAQQAFMRGKLKIKGNMGLAMKLGTVIKAAQASKASAPAAKPSGGAAKPSAGSNLKSAALFDQIAAGIADDPGMAKKIKGVIQFIITPGGAWVVDLKNGNGSVTQGKAKKADMTLTVKDDDMVAIAEGKLNAQQAFMRGKLKIKGNMGLAMKLGTVIKAAQKKSKL